MVNEASFPAFRLEEGVAVATGAGRGMGRMFSTALAHSSADVECVSGIANALPLLRLGVHDEFG